MKWIIGICFFLLLICMALILSCTTLPLSEPVDATDNLVVLRVDVGTLSNFNCSLIIQNLDTAEEFTKHPFKGLVILQNLSKGRYSLYRIDYVDKFEFELGGRKNKDNVVMVEFEYTFEIVPPLDFSPQQGKVLNLGSLTLVDALISGSNKILSRKQDFNQTFDLFKSYLPESQWTRMEWISE